MILGSSTFMRPLVAESVDDSCRLSQGSRDCAECRPRRSWDSSAAEPYGGMMRESMMVRLPCRGSRPPTRDENREQPYLLRARTAVTSSSCWCLETLTVDEPITTWSCEFRNEDALRWLEDLSIRFRSVASTGQKILIHESSKYGSQQ